MDTILSRHKEFVSRKKEKSLPEVFLYLFCDHLKICADPTLDAKKLGTVFYMSNHRMFIGGKGKVINEHVPFDII